MMLRRRAVNLNLDTYINFADPIVEAMCVSAWGDGTGLTRRQAIFVTDTQFAAVFNGTETGITSFNEMRFFAGLTKVPGSAFKDCTDLTSVSIPSSATRIYANAFSGCSSLSQINISHVDTIYGIAFKGCSSLAIELDLPNLNPASSLGLSSSYDAFNGSGITKIKSLGNETIIGNYANFANCAALTEVVLPATLTSMGRQQFQGCINLQTVVCLATTPPSISNSNFRNCGDAKIYVPYSADHSILQAYQTAWGAVSDAATYDVPRLTELTPEGEIPE